MKHATRARARLASLITLIAVLGACTGNAEPGATAMSSAEAGTAPSPAFTPGPAPVAPRSAGPTEAPPFAETPIAEPHIAQPTAPIGDNRDAIAEVVVDGGVRVRGLPGVDDASTRYEPLLRRGDEVFVIGGPVAGDGYDWYLVQALVDRSQGPFGWVSFASRGGEPWIEDVAATDCPSLPNDASRLGVMLDEVLIHCFGDGTIEFELDASVSCFADDPRVIDHDWLGLECSMLSGDACGTCGLRIAAHPEAGLDIARDYARWAVEGHFDDPASAACLPSPGVEPAQLQQAAVHACRGTLVLTSLERLGDATG